MANHHRGEASFTLDGRTTALRLTLGSLAELEDALGAADLAALGERLRLRPAVGPRHRRRAGGGLPRRWRAGGCDDAVPPNPGLGGRGRGGDGAAIARRTFAEEGPDRPPPPQA